MDSHQLEGVGNEGLDLDKKAGAHLVRVPPPITRHRDTFYGRSEGRLLCSVLLSQKGPRWGDLYTPYTQGPRELPTDPTNTVNSKSRRAGLSLLPYPQGQLQPQPQPQPPHP